MKPITLLIAAFIASGTTAQFNNPLAIPPALDLDTFDLVVDEHVHQFYPGVNTNTYGASAEYLGPTLILHRGDSARIRIHNELAQVTSMHWHGMHVPGEMDGGPPREVLPGESWFARFMVKNPAATYWYHPHPHELTAEQANFGLAGFIIVQDEDEAALDLPRTYGVDDFPAVVQDRKFQPNGDFAFYPFGDSVLVNGTPNAYLQCPAQVVRLRLLNGSNARIYALGLDNGQVFNVIAGDGGLLPSPVSTDRLWLSNGERAEVLLDFTGMEGDSLLLMSHGSELPQTVPGSGNILWESSALNGIDFPVMRIRVVAPTADPVTAIPANLFTHVAPDEAESVQTRTKNITGTGMVGMGMFMINGLMFDLNVVNDTVQLGSVEVWNVVNNSNMAHPMHIHGVSFFILERNLQPPPAWEQGPKDVVLVDRWEVVKLIMRFTEPTDGWPFMYHCHNLLHEDNMMMLQYAVVDPNMSISRANDQDGMNIFPIPTTGSLSWTSDEAVQEVGLLDPAGRAVRRHFVPSTKQGMLDLAGLPSGTYTLILFHGSGRAHAKVVVD
ncbi:MAG: multicopper oxidase domain-containing protein [Flavobacteriales bacterium]|nr:multicopper oxidase domain-containing protein [Flavobacteriales bacterium]